jgi:hypothetical protein
MARLQQGEGQSLIPAGLLRPGFSGQKQQGGHLAALFI